MTIMQWKQRFVRVTYQKFKRVPPHARLKFFLGNVRDAKQAILPEEGILKPSKIPRARRKKLHDYKHRIAAVFPDLFLLCDLYGMKLDYELQRVLDWFENQQESKCPGARTRRRKR